MDGTFHAEHSCCYAVKVFDSGQLHLKIILFQPIGICPGDGDQVLKPEQLADHAEITARPQIVDQLFAGLVFAETLEIQKQLLEKQTSALKRLSFEDSLTGLFNRNKFNQEISFEFL